jgi:transcriptional regulator with XRE-family HTH domain
MLSQNIRLFRKEKKLTQADLADKLQIKRSAIGAYEEGRAEPRLSTLRAMAELFNCSIDTLVEGDGRKDKASLDLQGEKLRILSVAIDQNDEEENISLVPEKASAGYTKGYGDADFIRRLPHFRMPFIELSPKRSYRVFQIKGDSMLPVPSGSYIMCEYLLDWTEIQNGECHIVVTRNEGVVYKRLYNQLASKGDFLLRSDNPDYDDYVLPPEEIEEVWRAKGFVSFRMPEAQARDQNLRHVSEVLHEIREDVQHIRHRIEKTEN